MDRLKQFFSDPWKTSTTILAVVAVALGVVALGPNEQPTGSTTTSTSTPGSSPTDPGVSDGFRGLLAVKIDNAPLARPQVGIGRVPLLVEYMAEGGITRFIAVVDQSAEGLLGPVRSLRPVDADLFPLLAPTIASTGGQPFVIREIDAGGTTRVEPDTTPHFMIAERPQPHHYFVDAAGLVAETPGFNPADPAFPAGSLPGGTSAPSASVSEWGLEFTFENDAYTRLQDAEPFQVMEEVDGPTAPLTHDVLVFLEVGQRSAGYTDGAGSPVFTYDVIGGGGMVALHDGEATRGTWIRRSHAEGFQFFDEAGNPIGLPDGRVYVALLPQGVEVEY
ncbi:MAG TPA: DUF3048 domain-containing protein [Acidimicrobiia bacterium]